MWLDNPDHVGDRELNPAIKGVNIPAGLPTHSRRGG